MYASRMVHTEVAKILIDKGADVEAKDQLLRNICNRYLTVDGSVLN